MKFIFKRISPFSGKANTIVVDITTEQYYAWHDGTPIQQAMPHLTPDEREFMMTDITPDETQI